MKRSLMLFGIPLIVLTYMSFVLFQKACDNGMSNHPDKKIAFNHQAHITKYGADKECTSCHAYEENGRYMGIPTVGTCTECHDRSGPSHDLDITTPLRKPFFDNYKDSDKPWGAYAHQPDLVYFSHKVVMSARYPDGRLKSRCGSCHGDKENSRTTAKIKGKMLMGQCMDCHRSLRISNKCAVCHK